jgi:hypothetical protein
MVDALSYYPECSSCTLDDMVCFWHMFLNFSKTIDILVFRNLLIIVEVVLSTENSARQVVRPPMYNP